MPSCPARRRTAQLVLGAALAGGCAAAPPVAQSPQAAHPAAHQAAPEPSAPTLDVRACAGVQAVVSHLAADTRRWSPTRDPFDKDMSSRIGRTARDLGVQASLADTPRVRRLVTSTAAAFGALPRAMASHDRTSVTRAITGTRTAYRALKRACSLT